MTDPRPGQYSSEASGGPISVRRAATGDYEAYCAMVAEVDQLHTQQEPLYFKDPGLPPRKREYFEALLADPSKALLVAEWGGHPRAYVHLETRRVEGLDILVDQDYAYVSDVVVHRSHQRLGLGRALMAEAEVWARQRGLGEIRLHVRSFNAPAIAFYDALGMKPVMQTMVKRFS
jgi:ribosomal protein S18 acetylase RimI-like enzyme